MCVRTDAHTCKTKATLELTAECQIRKYSTEANFLERCPCPLPGYRACLWYCGPGRWKDSCLTVHLVEFHSISLFG